MWVMQILIAEYKQTTPTEETSASPAAGAEMEISDLKLFHWANQINPNNQIALI